MNLLRGTWLWRRMSAGILALLVLTTSRAGAQPNTAPVRLAIIVEEPSAMAAADLLTVELSQKDRLSLLERAQIEKVYREQGLSAANKDYLKLGQILGADGLLVLEPAKEGTNQFLGARLVAVKPGVVLGFARVPWPLPDSAQWAKWIANHFEPLFPKLGVLVKDAIPISVVNLRSAVRSIDAQEIERQLTLLAIERLTRERELFVLERRRMELLAGEKELKGMNESAFWNGSCLLEGTIDRDGYSKETVTLSARLVPPKGGAPVSIEVSGSRTNLSEVINRLAAKVADGLKLGTRSAPWNAADEAAQYYEEAKWALKWGVFREAQAASESAWALGKRDLDCALARVQACTRQIHNNFGIFQGGSSDFGGIPDAARRKRLMESEMREISIKYPLGVVFDRNPTSVEYFGVTKSPDSEQIEQALHVLELYRGFSQTLPPDEPLVGSGWYNAGVEALDAASWVLQHFYFVPKSQGPVADKLAELRALARSVAAWISQSPTVQKVFWMGHKPVLATTYSSKTKEEITRCTLDGDTFPEDLAKSLHASPNIFSHKIDWGCFWKESPEDCVALYRELMTSPVFASIHGGIWHRKPENPRLIAWSTNDRERVPDVWRNFMQELNASTNVILQMEARAVELADAESDNEIETAFNGLFTTIFTNRNAIVTNNIELNDWVWEISWLVLNRGGVVTPTKERLKRQYSEEYQPKLKAMCDERQKYIAEAENNANYQRQKDYLIKNTPYDFFEFTKIFSGSQYSQTQAAELQPLLAAYKSNLVVQAQSNARSANPTVQNGIGSVGLVEYQLKRILNPVPPTPVSSEKSGNTNSRHSQIGKTTTAAKMAESHSDPATKVLLVKQFSKIPQERLNAEHLSELIVFAHRFREGKLWLDLRYQDTRRGADCAAVGAWNPQKGDWEIIQYSEDKNWAPLGVAGESEYGLFFETFNDAFYLSGRESLKRFDLKTRQWETLKIPAQKLVQLFAINGHLFAANDEIIFEILDSGRSTRVLASCRRRPVASALDSLDSLGKITLFPGPENSLRAFIGGNIYSWNGHDWRNDVSMGSNVRMEVFEDGAVLRSTPPPNGWWNETQRSPASLWRLPYEQTKTELCWQQWWDPNQQAALMPVGSAEKPDQPGPKPRWKAFRNLSLMENVTALSKSNLYFFCEHCDVTNVAGRWTAVERDGRHAELVCLDRDIARPYVLPLKFDLERGPLPSQELASKLGLISYGAKTWMLFAGDLLLIGRGNIPGVWAIPKSEIEAALAPEKERQRAQNLQQATGPDPH
jgi:hypothetical protein